MLKFLLKRVSKVGYNYLEVVGMNLNILNFLIKYKIKLLFILFFNVLIFWY